jgi:hypothetical protein
VRDSFPARKKINRQLARINDLFLIATKTTVHPLPNVLPPCGESAAGCASRITACPMVANCAREWPRRIERVRMDTRLLLLKFLLGEPSVLQDRACSLFYLAGTK